jgi:hypothetical protein
MTVAHPSMRRAKVEPKKNKMPEPEVYVVENETEQPHENVDILAANEQAIIHKSELPTPTPSPRKNETSLLEDLLFLGCAKKEIEIGKIKFEISTLTQKENSELVKELYKASDGADLFIIRAITLAYAIKHINGVPFDEVPLASMEEEAQFETVLSKKLYILEKMQKNIIEKLHDEYVGLVENSDKALGGDEGEHLKNS